jgi:hypothetical protein
MAEASSRRFFHHILSTGYMQEKALRLSAKGGKIVSMQKEMIP